MSYTTEIIANRALLRGRDEETGELLYFQRGEVIPAAQFGSGNALRSAAAAGHVTLVHRAVDDGAAEAPAPQRKPRP